MRHYDLSKNDRSRRSFLQTVGAGSPTLRMGLDGAVVKGIHEHPNCDGAAPGAASYHDFLVFVKSVENLEGGIMLDFGSTLTSPEVYLKALSVARNVAHQQGRTIEHFTTAVFDLVPIHGDIHHELPKTDPDYYFRPPRRSLSGPWPMEGKVPTCEGTIGQPCLH